jgi:hypothetical protein
MIILVYFFPNASGLVRVKHLRIYFASRTLVFHELLNIFVSKFIKTIQPIFAVCKNVALACSGENAGCSDDKESGIVESREANYATSGVCLN